MDYVNYKMNTMTKKKPTNERNETKNEHDDNNNNYEQKIDGLVRIARNTNP